MMLAAEIVVKRLMIVLGAMALAESLLFIRMLYRAAAGTFVLQDGQYGTEFAGLFYRSGIAAVCAAAFCLYCAVLSIGLRGRKISNISYTIKRLSLSEREIFGCFALHNILALLAFWGIQTLILLAFAGAYASEPGEILCGPQTIFLSFYQQSFLHGMLPLGDAVRYIVNMIHYVSLGMISAAVPISARTGKGEAGVMAVMTIWSVFFIVNSFGCWEEGLIFTGSVWGAAAGCVLRMFFGGVKDETA